MATKAEVLALHKQHPTWNSCQIARMLKCTDTYVRETFRRNGIINPAGGPSYKFNARLIGKQFRAKQLILQGSNLRA